MTSKERVQASLDGRPVDRFPVTSLYHYLYRMDHFTELTGLPAWRLREWLCTSPEHHLELFTAIRDKTPFELLQPHGAPSRAYREQVEFVEKDGHGWMHNRKTDEWHPLDTPKRAAMPRTTTPMRPSTSSALTTCGNAFPSLQPKP